MVSIIDTLNKRISWPIIVQGTTTRGEVEIEREGSVVLIVIRENSCRVLLNDSIVFTSTGIVLVYDSNLSFPLFRIFRMICHRYIITFDMHDDFPMVK